MSEITFDDVLHTSDMRNRPLEQMSPTIRAVPGRGARALTRINKACAPACATAGRAATGTCE